MLAASGKARKHTVMVRTLLKKGANPDVKDKAGNTALVNAVMGVTTSDTVDMVRLLLKHGATTFIAPRMLALEVSSPLSSQ